MNIEVNVLALLVASVLSMVVGFLWYGPMVFGKVWMKAKGMTADKMKKAQKSMGMMYGLSFVLALITAFVLSHVMTLSENFFHYPRLSTGLITAFWMWFGFMMPVQFTATMFGDKNWKLLGIDTGYQFASLMVMGGVLGLL